MTLAELPTDHPLRNTPLVDIEACFVYCGEKTKRFVKPTWKIARSTYNDLGEAWTSNAAWLTPLA